MNIDPQLLRDAIVQQAIQAAALTNLNQRLADAQQQLAARQQDIDALAKDRHETKQALEARVRELTELNNANAEALGDAAKHFGFETVDAFLAAVQPAPEGSTAD